MVTKPFLTCAQGPRTVSRPLLGTRIRLYLESRREVRSTDQNEMSEGQPPKTKPQNDARNSLHPHYFPRCGSVSLGVARYSPDRAPSQCREGTFLTQQEI